MKAGKLKGTTDYAVLSEMDAVSICVPTPLRKTGDPDLSYISSATESPGSLPARRHGGRP